MKLRLIVFLFSINYLFPFASYSQIPSSYKKYSYLLVLMNGKDTIGNATGFFVKKCNTLYLVSNFHVLTNKNYNNLTQISPKWNRILIRYGSEKLWEYYPLDLRKVWKETDLIKSMPVDIWAVKIPELLKKAIFKIDIDDNSVKDQNIKVGSKVFIYGFPTTDFRKQRNYNKRTPMLIVSNLVQYDNKAMNGNNVGFTMEQPIFHGISGAPAFALNNQGKIKFLGIMYGSEGTDMNHLKGVGFRCDVITRLLPLCQ